MVHYINLLYESFEFRSVTCYSYPIEQNLKYECS